MENTYQINGFEELISYFNEPHVSFAQIKQITNEGLKFAYYQVLTKS